MAKIYEFMEALKEGKAFDWISNNGHELNKDDLISIIKEYDYAIYSMGICDGKEDLYDTVYENLTDRYDYE